MVLKNSEKDYFVQSSGQEVYNCVTDFEKNPRALVVTNRKESQIFLGIEPMLWPLWRSIVNSFSATKVCDTRLLRGRRITTKDHRDFTHKGRETGGSFPSSTPAGRKERGNEKKKAAQTQRKKEEGR